MEDFLFCLMIQLNLVFGVAGLLWPEKVMQYHAVLLFPWRVTHRAIRIHGIVAIAGWLFMLAKLVLQYR